MEGIISNKILSKIDLYEGQINMPKGFEINRDKLSDDILNYQLSNNHNNDFPFSKTWDMLNTYIIEHIYVEYSLKLINKKTWGNFYKPNQISQPLSNINLEDLLNSPDYTLLYGIKTNKCFIRIYFDDNRRKGKIFDIEIKDNMFIMFPSSNMYIILNNQKNNLNFIQTITYQYI